MLRMTWHSRSPGCKQDSLVGGGSDLPILLNYNFSQASARWITMFVHDGMCVRACARLPICETKCHRQSDCSDHAIGSCDMLCDCHIHVFHMEPNVLIVCIIDIFRCMWCIIYIYTHIYWPFQETTGWGALLSNLVSPIVFSSLVIL